MNPILSLARSSRWLLLSATVTSVISGLGGALLVALINRSLDVTRGELGRLGLQFVGLSVGMLLLRWLSQAQFVELSQRTLFELRQHVSREFAEASYRDIEARGPGRSLAVLTEDVGEVAEFFVTLPRLVMHGAVVLGCLGYLAFLSGPVFLFALGMVLLGSLGHRWGSRLASASLERARLLEDDLFGHFRALFAGAKELKLNAARRQAFLSEVLGENAEQVRSERTRGLRIYVGSASFGSFLFFAVIGAVLFALTALSDVEGQVRSGYALMFLYLMLPLQTLLDAIPSISLTRVAIERIRQVSTPLDGRVRPSGAAEPLPGPFESLRLCGVVHRYRRDSEDGVFELGPIDLELRPGDLVFLAGSNGSGKTTLAKVLVGLYPPEDGYVLLNGVRVGSSNEEAYRQHFSAVFSDFHLFDRLLGIHSGRLDQRAEELLQALDLAHKVRVQGGVLSTTELSRGQQKRLALLVAWLEDRPVYVFDEWAADQDPVYKEVFYGRLLPELKARRKCVFVITHDDRYFSRADRCLLLSEGRLVMGSAVDPLLLMRESALARAAAVRVPAEPA